MPTENIPGSEDGRSALGVDNYTEKEYNNYGWARENGVLSASENESLRSRFAEAVTGQAKPPKTKSDEYMIAIGDNTDNKIVYMKGTIDEPVITRVLKIDEHNETKIDELRRETYALERRGIQQEAGGVFYTYTSASFGGSSYQQRSGTQSQRYNNQFGVKRGRGSKETSKVKEILFDDGNEISRTYRNVLSSEDFRQVAWFDGRNTVYIDAKADRVDTFSALLGHEMFHKMFKSKRVKKLMEAWNNTPEAKRTEVTQAYMAFLKENTDLGIAERVNISNEEVAAAKRWLNHYKKLFNEVAELNLGESARQNAVVVGKLKKRYTAKW